MTGPPWLSPPAICRTYHNLAIFFILKIRRFLTPLSCLEVIYGWSHGAMPSRRRGRGFQSLPPSPKAKLGLLFSVGTSLARHCTGLCKEKFANSAKTEYLQPDLLNLVPFLLLNPLCWERSVRMATLWEWKCVPWQIEMGSCFLRNSETNCNCGHFESLELASGITEGFQNCPLIARKWGKGRVFLG